MTTAASPQLIGAEFNRLTSAATALLEELREYPPYGRLWESHFHRTFDHFMRLWLMQQEYRQILERQEVYGLQRSEIGQIASKIGQLYYHLYLRTGDLRFLKESLVFYGAIHMRGYFEMPADAQTPRMLHARLRFFARYIVVTLLFDKLRQARELAKDLHRYVEEFAKSSGSTDPTEWDLLIEELNRFLDAENLLSIENVPEDLFLSRRLPPRLPGAESRPHIDQAILVSNFSHQIKFSELTLDTYRICHLLESDLSNEEAAAAGSTDAADLSASSSGGSHVPKHLLYRPTVSKVLSHLSQSHSALSRSFSILFVYLSADGFQHPTVLGGSDSTSELSASSSAGSLSSSSSTTSLSVASSPRPEHIFPPSPSSSSSSSSDTSDAVPSSPSRRSRRTSSLLSQQALTSSTAGGLAMNSSSSSSSLPATNSLSGDFLYPHDLVPFLRRPFFLIVDSDNSTAFKTLRPFFNQPLVCLMSPEAQPPHFKDSTHSGNLFTFFLYDPVAALCFICGVQSIQYETFTACQKLLMDACTELDPLFETIEKVPQSVKFMINDFALKTIFFRFLFCYSALSYHKSFNSPRMLPAITPVLPHALLLSPVLRGVLSSITSLLDIQVHFLFPASTKDTV